MSYIQNEKNEKNEYCEKCDFTCRYISDYRRHLLTAKHKMITNDDKSDDKTSTLHNTAYTCDCGKEYKHRQGLYAHKKKCSKKTPENADISHPPPENRIVHESISEAMVIKCFQTMMAAQAAQAARDEARDEAQAEQTRLLIEAISLKAPSQCITNNTTNNQFNLNVFLNEDCKDAYTLKEVMESIVCTVDDLDRLILEGYAATVTRKIIESMQDMSITERPIHCTDLRRNTVCVKNESGWQKGELALKLLNNSLYFIGRKISNTVPEWRETYPDHFRGTESRRNQYHTLIVEVLKVDDRKLEDRNVGIVCRSIVLDRKTAKLGIV
jgi:hypothetical protein